MMKKLTLKAALTVMLLAVGTTQAADKAKVPAKPADKAKKTAVPAVKAKKTDKSAAKAAKPEKSTVKPPPKSVAKPANGSSLERAIVIRENDTVRGIAAENRWIRDHLPGYRKTGQELIRHKKGIYDKITVQGPNGATGTVYFEISQFFGRINGKLLQ